MWTYWFAKHSSIINHAIQELYWVCCDLTYESKTFIANIRQFVQPRKIAQVSITTPLNLVDEEINSNFYTVDIFNIGWVASTEMRAGYRHRDKPQSGIDDGI